MAYVTQRDLSATPAQVFAAMADVRRLARWWGPDGFTNAFEQFDFIAGARWVYTMIGPDGTAYANVSEILTLEADRLLHLRHVSRPHFDLRILLEPLGGHGTRLIWTQTFDDPAVAAALKAIVEPANEQNLNRLEAELARGG